MRPVWSNHISKGITLWYLILIFWLIIFGLIIWQQRKTIVENEDKIEGLIAEGLRVQNNAIEEVSRLSIELQKTNGEWQKGLDDQVEIYDAMLLDEKDLVASLQQRVDYLETDRDAVRRERDDQVERFATLYKSHERILMRMAELEMQHMYHEDHCLPVLQHMREAVTV